MSNKVDDFLNKIQTKEVNLTKISKEAGISYGKMHKWKQRNVQSSQINQEDYEKLSKYLDKKKDTDENLDTKKDTLDKDVLKMVAQSNLNQSEANKNQSIANRKLAESISALTHQFTGGGSSEIREEMAQKFADLILIIQKLATGQPIDEDLSTFWSVEKSKNVSSDNSLAG